MTEESSELAPSDTEREYLMKEIQRLREEHSEMVYIAFPGDEKSSGGCVAAGRGFFHINSHGGAEPCPFSPYSDVNIRNSSLREAMHSPLFMALQSGDVLLDDHAGGCVLYEKRELVESLIAQSAILIDKSQIALLTEAQSISLQLHYKGGFRASLFSNVQAVVLMNYSMPNVI